MTKGPKSKAGRPAPSTRGARAPLVREEGLARWRQIAEEITAELRDRRHAPGDRLATEQELAERFGVNRHTLRRAMASLQQEGLIRIEQGRGMFVEAGAVDYAIGRRTRFSDNMRSQLLSSDASLIATRRLAADARLAKALKLRAGSPVLLLETLRRADGLPLTLGRHHFPAKRFDGLVEAYRELGSITKALGRFGVVDYLREETRITGRLPSPAEARLLEMPRTRPILVVEAVNVDVAGWPIEFGLTQFVADRVQLTVDPRAF